MLKKIARQVVDNGIEPMAQTLPNFVVKRVVNEATVGLKFAMCFHRVLDAPRPQMLQPELAHSEQDLDTFLDLFSDVSHRLTMSFDDGYEDARRYIDSRAPHHPDVTWLFMVCPEKLKARLGFTWDAYKRAGNDDALAFAKWWSKTAERAKEHKKEDLVGLADEDDYLLSTADEIAELTRHANVELGDHTNHHIPTAWMSAEDVQAELEQSHSDFEKLFGPPRHFAFPYGTPEIFVLKRDLEIVAETHNTTTWTVDVRPYAATDAVPGAVLPRFAWNSKKFTPKGIALYIAMKCFALKAARARQA